jgi:hypothetical protein
LCCTRLHRQKPNIKNSKHKFQNFGSHKSRNDKHAQDPDPKKALVATETPIQFYVKDNPSASEEALFLSASHPISSCAKK